MQVLNIFHVLIAIAMIAFILVQRGPGATAGAAFGSGASGTVFGARGSGSFLSRGTWVLALLFCLISLSMAVIVSRSSVAPETDLGVVGSAQPAAVEEQASEPAPDDAGQGTDLPELDTSSGDESQGDLPAMDAAPEAEAAAETADGQAGDDTGRDPEDG